MTVLAERLVVLVVLLGVIAVAVGVVWWVRRRQPLMPPPDISGAEALAAVRGLGELREPEAGAYIEAANLDVQEQEDLRGVGDVALGNRP